MKRILILGGGFAGLVAAEKLSEKYGDKHQITLVSPNREFTFYPALVHLAFGKVEKETVTFDLAQKLHRLKVRFIQGEVLHLHPELKRVQITGKEINGNLSYDYLFIALGRRLATEVVPGFFEHAHHLLGVKAAERFGKALETIKHGDVVVGLAPDSELPVAVCETAFWIAQRLRPDSPTTPTTIKVVFPGTINEAFGGAQIAEELRSAFSKHHIKVIENFKISEISRKQIISRDGKTMAFDLAMLLPPFRGQARLSENGITDKENFVEVDEYMKVKGMKHMYAAGDIVSYPGPKLAHVAVGQAQIAVANLIGEIEGEEPDAIYYHEISSIIDQGGAESIYLHYGVWDDTLYNLKKGKIWSLIKRLHDRIWRSKHENVWFEKGV